VRRKAKTLQLNLPIYDQLANSKNILIAGAGGGFDVFCGLPIYFALRTQGKRVHLANYSFTSIQLAEFASQAVVLGRNLIGVSVPLKHDLPYFPEGYLSQWFKEVRNEDIIIWLFANSGALPLTRAYQTLVEHLGIDAIILIDGGVDSIMRGDEAGAGTLIEDTISLAAVDLLNIPVKILACLGFGTEVEEEVCHYNALQNISALTKAGGFLGSCSLIPQMDAFQQYEAACKYVWSRPNHPASHISTRVIPAVNGEFGTYEMFPSERPVSAFVSPFMGLYWFFSAREVITRNLILDLIRDTYEVREAFGIAARAIQAFRQRPRRAIPY
jgi:hypothetical protein